MINTGFAGNFALSAKADEVYIATTYLSRGGRGEREPVKLTDDEVAEPLNRRVEIQVR